MFVLHPSTLLLLAWQRSQYCFQSCLSRDKISQELLEDLDGTFKEVLPHDWHKWIRFRDRSGTRQGFSIIFPLFFFSYSISQSGQVHFVVSSFLEAFEFICSHFKNHPRGQSFEKTVLGLLWQRFALCEGFSSILYLHLFFL